MKSPKKFGEVLSELIQRKRLSIAALAERLEGKAFLKRAMQDELPPAKREATYQRLCELGLFTEDELKELQSGLEVSRIGVREYLVKNALLRLMSNDSLISEDEIANEEFHQRLQAIESADEVSVLCVNCCYPSLFTALSRCFTNHNANITMRHYVNLGREGCDAASLVYCATPLIGDPRYQPFSIPVQAGLQCIDGDFCIISYTKGGRQTELFFIMRSGTELYLLPHVPQLRLISFWDDMLSGVNPPPAAIKELNAPGMRYVDIMMRYLALELNRATYTVSADFAYMQIPPELLSTSLNEQALHMIGLTDAELQQMKAIILRRYQNLYTKNKPSYQIVSILGIEKFLQTGITQGSFRGFRTFTPAERVRILNDILQKSRNDEHYHLYLFKDRNYQVKYTTICFDKLGVSVLPKIPSDNARADFNHMFLTIPEFTQHFISHYKNQMVASYCHSEEESYDILRGILSEYAESIAI